MTQNRKRGRIIHPDEVEFMPLSKRINNLHLNSNMLLENPNLVNHGLQVAGWDPGPLSYSNLGSEVPFNSPRPPEPIHNMNFSNSISYNPDLNEIENPHYFYKNKLLFEMHMARLQRNTVSNY